MFRLTFLGLGLVLAGGAMALPIAQVLNTNTTLDNVNLPTNGGATFNTVGFIGGTSLAKTPTGDLIAADPNGNLFMVNGPTIPVGPTGKAQIGDLDYGVGGLWGYSNATQELFFFDLGSNSVTYSQAIAIPGTVTGVAYEISTGDVYLSAFSTFNNDKLLRVQNSATSATLVGTMNTTDAASYISDIDFDTSGNLVAMTWFHRHFYQVNTTSAGTSLISAGPHKDTVAMALDAVPEPATWAALGVGLLLARKRKTR